MEEDKGDEGGETCGVIPPQALTATREVLQKLAG